MTSNEVPLVFSGLAQRAKLGRLEGTSIGGNWSQWRCLRELNPYSRAENSKSLPLDESTNFYLFYLMYILYHKFLKKSKIFFGTRGRIRTCDNGVADRGLSPLDDTSKKVQERIDRVTSPLIEFSCLPYKFHQNNLYSPLS